MKTNRITGMFSHRWLLALGLTLLPLAAHAETFKLASVDFVSEGDKTNIILHTGSIVPVHRVQVSDNKLILDIDQIDADETVRTNFAGAANISHVIMQPLNEHKIRMIIRGEDLGMPSVAFFNANGAYMPNTSAQDNHLMQDTDADMQRIQEAGIQPATLEAQDLTAPATEPIAMTALQPSAAMPAPTSQKPGKLAPLPLEDSPAEAGAQNDFFNFLPKGKLETYIPYGLLAMVLLGAGAFIRHRLIQLRQPETQLEDLIEEQAKGKKVSFREMADAYRNKHDKPEMAPVARKPAPKSVNTDEPIGLGAFKQPETILPSPKPAQPQKQAPSLDDLIQLMQTAQAARNQAPAKPAPTSPAKKQVLNQYLKSQPQNANPNEELQRARQMQQQVQQDAVKRAAKPGISSPANPINWAPAAHKAATKQAPVSNPNPNPRKASAQNLNAQGPLPGNPEVLNFLRNVADLMEKDGKTDIARNIHKNLNGQNLGLLQ